MKKYEHAKVYMLAVEMAKVRIKTEGEQSAEN